MEGEVEVKEVRLSGPPGCTDRVEVVRPQALHRPSARPRILVRSVGVRFTERWRRCLLLGRHVTFCIKAANDAHPTVVTPGVGGAVRYYPWNLRHRVLRIGKTAA